MTADARIHGKVAKILNTREVAINAGQDQGVQTGMLFDILAPAAQDIEDPDTGEVLGSIERSKVRVQITHVTRRVSVGRTYRRTGLFDAMAWALVSSSSSLKTADATWEDLDEADSYVATGDPVVQVLESASEREMLPEPDPERE